jgi:hypothetical protein
MEFIEICYLETNFRIYLSGIVYRLLKGSGPYGKKGEWVITTKLLNKSGYYRTDISNKHILVHRLIAYAYLGLDITNSKIQVDHINLDRSDNRVCNLRLVTHQQNQFNTNAKGYYKTKYGRYQSEIIANGVYEYLGTYATLEEARNKYLEAKKIKHVI